MTQKEEILRKTNNGLDVFRHYIKTQWRVGRNFLNPLYDDHQASCNIYYDRKSGTYKMKDFGNPDYSGDCFFLVAFLNGLDCNNASDFVEVLRHIDRDMGLGLAQEDTRPVIQSQHTAPVSRMQEGVLVESPVMQVPKEYNFTSREFMPHESIFWNKSGIDSHTLNAYEVISLTEFRGINNEGKPFRLLASLSEPMFGYKRKGFIKIYRPFSKLRFLYGGEMPQNYCFGLEQLPAKGDILFITGGEKDVLSLAAHGFYAISFNSETCNIPEEIIRHLSFRFKHIVILYDSDKTGLESSATQTQRLKDYAVQYLVLPLAGTKQEKDISDYFTLGHTREDLLTLFLRLLDRRYSETMSALKSCEVDFSNPPPAAQIVISADNVPLGTQGNLLCITGGEGTGKSNYMAALVAGAVGTVETGIEKNEIDTLGVSVTPNEADKAILFYDTEQSVEQLYKNIGNLLRRAGRKEMPSNLRAFCLTGMSRKDRLLSIIQSMDRFHYQYGGIYMVVIDGIADLVRGANEEAECVAVVEELYRLAGIYRTCITTVLHFVPAGLKLRGHLGSELQRKAASILSIEKDIGNPAISVVKALKVRDGSPLDVPLMQFIWDKEKRMHVYHGEKTREERDLRKEKELAAVAREIFDQQPKITYIDLCEQIQSAMDVKERTAKSYIKFMRDKEIIIRDPMNNSYFIISAQEQKK